jgi:hypothetical protein
MIFQLRICSSMFHFSRLDGNCLGIERKDEADSEQICIVT